MPDRLAEIRRQRALVAEHLAWLDREIAAAAPASAAPVAPTAPAVVPAPIAPPATAPSTLDPAAILAAAAAAKPAAQDSAAPSIEDDIAEKHLPRRQPGSIQQDVRRGCLLYFAIAALLVFGLCALLVWVSRAYNKSHPPAPPPPQEQFEERH